MIEILIIVLKVLVVLLAFGGLMWLSWKYISWPPPAGPWGNMIVALVLLIVALIVMMQWAFKINLGGLGTAAFLFGSGVVQMAAAKLAHGVMA